MGERCVLTKGLHPGCSFLEAVQRSLWLYGRCRCTALPGLLLHMEPTQLHEQGGSCRFGLNSQSWLITTSTQGTALVCRVILPQTADIQLSMLDCTCCSQHPRSSRLMVQTGCTPLHTLQLALIGKPSFNRKDMTESSQHVYYAAMLLFICV